ncbi:MAG: cell wall hydrolase [Lachnospiraceae bacterium]|nr:cell wall hydrolase [Lachnospiraceae bacterium]
MSKKMSASIIVLGLIFILLSVAVTTVAAQELVALNTEEVEATESMDSLWDLSAGVATFVNPSVETSSEEETKVALENAATLAQTPEEEEEAPAGIVMSDAGDTLDVMADPNEEAEVVGFLYEDCGGKIIEQKDGWTLIRSGDLVGWAKDEDLAFDDKAVEMAQEAGQSIVIVTTGALRARTAPEQSAEVVTVLARGEELDFIEDLGEWIAADFNNEVVYLASEYVSRDFTVDTGETVEEIEAREEAKRLEEERLEKEAAELEEAEAKKREEEAKKIEEAQAAAFLEAQAAAEAAAAAALTQATTEAQPAPVAANPTDEQIAQMLEAQAALEAAQRAAATQAAAAAATPEDVRLLGALIYCEAGNQSYEGKVAVGAVVMNRVKSSRYPNTIDGVIRASGQFTPVRSGKVDRIYASGVPEECMLAAQDALAGVSPVGDATHFRRNNGRPGQVLGAHVFY